MGTDIESLGFLERNHTQEKANMEDGLHCFCTSVYKTQTQQLKNINEGIRIKQNHIPRLILGHILLWVPSWKLKMSSLIRLAEVRFSVSSSRNYLNWYMWYASVICLKYYLSKNEQILSIISKLKGKKE